MELTVLIPCLNEAETIGICVTRARKLLMENGIDGEVLVSDNGSTDGSQQIARSLGARVEPCHTRGYGAALLNGIVEAKGSMILMGDGDDSYRFDEAFPMIAKLREGYDVCMGTRLKGRIESGAMPPLNRHIGNPVLTRVGQTLFGTPTSDFHCGMRAFRKESIMRLGLVTTGMEWASEMVIKSSLRELRIAEVPITLYKDGRSRAPHLRPWRDGWRHLRLMLVHAPNWLFTLPGCMLLSFGAGGEILISSGGRPSVQGEAGIYWSLACAFSLIAAVQLLLTGASAKVYSQRSGILPTSPEFYRASKKLTLEKLLILAAGCGTLGAAGISSVLFSWWKNGAPGLDYQQLAWAPDYEQLVRVLIPSFSLLTLAVLCVFNGFLLSLLFLPTVQTNEDWRAEDTTPATSTLQKAETL